MKKILAMVMAVSMTAVALVGCSSAPAETTAATAATTAGDTTTEAPATDAATPAMEGYISVVSREDGSGTRGAFIELLGIEQENADGEKEDMTSLDAEITNSTSVMMTTVQGNEAAIGYVSLGSMNDTVKAVKIDGADATAENVKSGSYKVARPFNIATIGEVSEVAQDFMNYILSDEGQKIAEENGLISEGSNGAYTASGVSGKVTIAGSTSVTPVMEKLAEAYKVINADVEIEIQSSGSTAGMTSALEGVCDIGMASRELKDSEIEAGLVPTVIALDGIAIVVNTANPIEDLESAQVTAIFTGETTDWSEIQ